ncbi:glycosyltransferase family 9 protein [Endozoicomonas lisbonensis]|uniref:Heptosyltransferase-3 n=1 Tax=Endozoicomonas lisbonensis TaxID=3120522 RepID=A0ABV2SII5_9GAMM
MKAAIFPISTLGDGLIFTILAQGLSNSGFETTLFSSTLSELGSILKDFNTKDCDQLEKIDFFLESCDLIICDPHNAEINSLLSTKENFLKKTVWVTCTRCPEKYLEKKVHLHNFKFASGALYNKEHSGCNMVQHAVNFCKNSWNLSEIKSTPNIEILKNYKFQRNKNRVCIFPYTPEKEKTYHICGFEKIALELKKNAADPVFIGTKKQLTKFRENRNTCTIPFISFESIFELAIYIYESGFVIANDSGGGHLASLLNIPTVTIHKKNNSFKWKPGWRKSYIVTPIITLKFFGQRIWSPFIPKKKIINHVMNYNKKKPSQRNDI